MNKYKISALYSVYKNENPVFLNEAIMSMINQTRKVDEIVIIEDGPLTDELYNILSKLEAEFPKLIKRYPLSENKGLGLALKYGVEKCRYELIARMDTDDISIEDRIRLQENEFIYDKELDIVGGHIAEFDENPEECHSTRKVPLIHDDIVKYQKLRSAFNHVTVMFKKDAVIKAGNYEDGIYMEDDLLWHNMIATGAKTKNLDIVLCKVRVGSGMYERRGGNTYLKLYASARKIMLERKQISYFDYVYSIMIQVIVAIVPVGIRKFIFQKLLRK